MSDTEYIYAVMSETTIDSPHVDPGERLEFTHSDKEVACKYVEQKNGEFGSRIYRLQKVELYHGKVPDDV